MSLRRAHELFRHWEPYIGLLIAAGFFTWVAKSGRVLGVDTWQEATLLGVAVASGLMLALAALLFGLRYFSPYPSPAGRSGKEPSPASPEEISATKRLRQEADYLKEKYQAVISDYQRMNGLEVRFSDMLDGLKRQIRSDNETIRSNHGALQEKIVALEAGADLDRRQVRTQVYSIFNALAAVYHREQLRDWAATIEAMANELRAPTTHDQHLTHDQWEQWATNERTWRTLLTQWCDLAACYYPGIKEHVLTLSEEQFMQTGVAKATQFPEPEAYTAYKAFCGRLKNWHNWQGEAERAVHQAAFNGGAVPAPPKGLFSAFEGAPNDELK
jgi:hypothetical protein